MSGVKFYSKRDFMATLKVSEVVHGTYRADTIRKTKSDQTIRRYIKYTVSISLTLFTEKRTTTLSHIQNLLHKECNTAIWSQKRSVCL